MSIPNIRGKVKIIDKTLDKNTGEVIYEDEGEIGDNIFLKNGMTSILSAFADSGTSDIIDTIRIGDDVGSGGTGVSPIPATDDYTESDQNELYSVSIQSSSNPNYYTLEVNTTLRGQDALGNFPGETELRYTSIAMYSGSGTAIAYRRFPVRIITAQSSVEIQWTLFFEGES